MESDFEEIDFEDRTFFSARLLFSLPVVINGNKTEVTFNSCGHGANGVYYAVNLERNGSFVNSYTMISAVDAASKVLRWKFEEDHVPRELKTREQEFSDVINNKGKLL